MIRIYLIILMILCLVLNSCVTNKPYTQEMKDNLKLMFKMDQDSQKYDEKRLGDKKYVDSMNVNQDRIMRANAEVVKNYFQKYGFPGAKLNDEKNTTLFWVIVQHADHDVKFQEQVLKVMKREVEKGNAPKRKYAYLYDRVCKNKGEKQLFGTQMIYDSAGRPFLYPTEDSLRIDKRRKEFELEPISDYISRFK